MPLAKLPRLGWDAFQRSEARVDASLSLLLGVQLLVLFVVVPVGWRFVGGRVLLDGCHFAFAAVCILVLARRRAAQVALLLGMAMLVGGPLLDRHLPAPLRLSPSALFAMLSLIAFAFNALIAAIVARHVFASGRVTAHRLQGAVLLYLNVAALFSILYNALDTLAPGAIVAAGGGLLPREIPAHAAALSYFSLTTITTTGFGDLVPIDPIARSLANLESVFGHLFPATLLARLVALHVAHGNDARPVNASRPPTEGKARRGRRRQPVRLAS